MKNKFAKFISVILSAFMLFGVAACGDNPDGPGGDDGIEIKIYAGGSSQYQWKKGSKENEVLNYIEDEFEKDTGIKLNFNPQFYGMDMKSTLGTSTDVDIVISHVGGGDGLDDWMMSNDRYRDLFEDLEDFENIAKWTKWSDGANLNLDAMDRVTTQADKVLGIPSVINPYRYGILVRKDWMEACGYTDDPAMERQVCSETGANYILVDNYYDFEEMCVAMKNKYNLNFAVSGAIYEVEATGLLGAYGLDAGFWTMTTVNDPNNPQVELTNYAGYINPDYAKILEVESRWIQKGVLRKSPSDIKVDECESHFISGATGVFLQNGSIEHLIEVARACESENAGAEFTVISGLVKDRDAAAKRDNGETVDVGTERKLVATFMASIMNNSPDSEEILTFLDWVYESEENYNLCRYGVEGVHWIDNGDGTYSYPEGSGFTYHNKPYSGILTLVENQVISNLRYAGYTQTELEWFDTVENKDNYIVNPLVDYLLRLSEADMKGHYGNSTDISYFCEDVWAYKDEFKDFTVDGTLGDTYRAKVSSYLSASAPNDYCRKVNERYKYLAGLV